MQIVEKQASETRISLSASFIVAVGIGSAWIAAGSSGMLAHGLQHLLVCLILGAIVIAGWPRKAIDWKSWVNFVAALAIAFCMAVSSLQVVNILAVAVVLSLLGHYLDDLDGRAIGLAAKAVFCFAVCRLLLEIPGFWFLGEYLGRAFGWLAGKMTGRELSVGATFGGVDFLLLMAAVYAFWLRNTASPKIRRAVSGGLAILFAQLAYLFVLAFSDAILSALPEAVYPVEDDYLRMGAWVWQNAARTMIPWNLPLVALVLQTLIAAKMFRTRHWQFVQNENEDSPAKGDKSDDVISLKALFFELLTKLGPAVAAILLAAAAALWMTKPDVRGKTILAYRSGNVDWSKPEYDKTQKNGFGLLADFTVALGGKFAFSEQLSPAELADADAVLLLDPDDNLSPERLSRLRDYVRSGGSLLVAVDQSATEASQKKASELLESCGVRITQNTATGRTESWEQSCSGPIHPTTLGANDSRGAFGIDRSASLDLHGGARPILIGRWGWSSSTADASQNEKQAYSGGGRLGDLVLAAEAASGGGKIVVLGDRQCLSNDVLPSSYEFLGRLFGDLTRKSPAFPWWRTWGILGLVILLSYFIGASRKPSQLMATAAIFALALVFCRAATADAQRIVVGGGKASPRLAYIDASHAEAYSDMLWHPKAMDDTGIVGLARALIRENFLPLRLTSLNPEQLSRGNLLISIAPGRSYSAEERNIIEKFVRGGGTFLALVGAEESRASNPILAQFGLEVPHSPVLPGETIREPDPWPRKDHPPANFTSGDGAEHPVDFYAGWSVKAKKALPESEYETLVGPVVHGRERPTVVFRRVERGCVVVIADTYFACNRNLELSSGDPNDNMRFWSWLLQIISPRESSAESGPPADVPAKPPAVDLPLGESGPDEG